MRATIIRKGISDYIQDQINWSQETFGPGRHTLGLIKHIGKELDEIKEDPLDVEEWVDVIILGIDGAWRAGFTARQVAEALIAKQEVNRKREWGPVVSEDEPIEHVRSLAGMLGEK